MERTTPIRTIVADDDPLARRLVKDALQADGITVIAEASGGREAVELSVHYKPDVVIMDLLMPGIDGLEATRRIQASQPEVRVVVLTSSEDEELGMHTLRGGAAGFLNKTVDLDALPRAVRGVAAGEAAVSRQMTMMLIDRLRHVREGGAGMRPVRSRLTGREWEVLDLLCDGATTDDIADQLVLSTETVRSHVKNLLRKLGVSSRAEAIDIARRVRDGELAADAIGA